MFGYESSVACGGFSDTTDAGVFYHCCAYFHAINRVHPVGKPRVKEVRWRIGRWPHDIAHYCISEPNCFFRREVVLNARPPEPLSVAQRCVLGQQHELGAYSTSCVGLKEGALSASSKPCS